MNLGLIRRLALVLCASLFASALTTGLVPLTSSSATAALGTVWSHNGVLYDNTCRNHSYGYSVSPGSSDWDLDVELIGPDGQLADFDYKFGPSDPVSGSGRFLFCGSELPGRYEIHATLTWYDEEYNDYSESLPVATFRMRKPYSRTSLSVSDRTPHFNEVVKFRSQTRDERSRGYFPTDYPTVVLQVRTSGGWVKVKGSRTIGNDRGVATWRYRWNIRRIQKVRAVSLRSSSYQSSASRAVTVDTTRNGRVAVRDARVSGLL